MIAIIIEQIKTWYHTHELRVPSYQWWGIFTLTLMMSMHLDPNLRTAQYLLPMQFGGLMFVVMGLLRRRKG